MADFSITGNIVDIEAKRIYKGKITVKGQRILTIEEVDKADNNYIIPGFIDAHVHIESSMLVPSEFARIAVTHGTVATVSDPHEIANVLGVEGVEYMIDNGRQVPFKFYFGAPSCVPATIYETAGAEISIGDIECLLSKPEIRYLAEMMNWPGVLNNDAAVYEKIAVAKRFGKRIDGHAPGLRGKDAYRYASAGITSDHECVEKGEALDKIAAGMKILIREGSAAKNFDALIDLLDDHEDYVMFCSDDKHPDSLMEGHIDQLVKRALQKGIDLFKVLKAACLNPVRHYGLEVGLLRSGDYADFLIIDDPDKFTIKRTYINGQLVAENRKAYIETVPVRTVNRFHTSFKKAGDFSYVPEKTSIQVIKALDGQIVTDSLFVNISGKNAGSLIDIDEDILKISVVNRYNETKPAIGFINGFGLKKGAIAASVAHDSHNIVVVGTNDEDICMAVNEIIRSKGGISVANGADIELLPLEVAGLMSVNPGELVARRYSELDEYARKLGSGLSSPFMTLSFMALLVIPSLKMSDKGLFDAQHFQFVD